MPIINLDEPVTQTGGREGLPTPEQEALQEPGSGEPTKLFPELTGELRKQYGPGPGAIYNRLMDIGKMLIDPAVLLNPENIAGGGGGTRYLKSRVPKLEIEQGGKATTRIATERQGTEPRVINLDEPVSAPKVINLDEPLSIPGPTHEIPLPTSTEPLPKYAGSINLERIKTDDDVKRAILDASKAVPMRDPISEETILESAAKQGFALEDAEKFAHTTQAQRAKYLATRNVQTALAEQYEHAKTVWKTSDTPETFAKLQDAGQAFLRGFKAAQTVASEAGLALRSFQILSKGDIKTTAERTINQLLVQLQTKGPISEELTKRLATLDLNDATQANTFIKELSTKTAKFGDKIYEAWLNSILSGPQTHAANIAGNAIQLSVRPFDRIGSAMVDLTTSTLTGAPRERYAIEGALDLWGMSSSLPAASRAFLQTARTGMVSYGSKIETSPGAKIGGTAGEVVRLPTKILQATDEFFKALSSEGSKRVTAYRAAAAEGLSGQARLDRMKEFIATPTEAMHDKMTEEALRATFQTDLGRWGKAAIRFRDEIEPLKYVMPFIKTPTNIAKEGLKRTPLGWLDTAADAYHGRLPVGGNLSDDLSRKLIGTGLSAWMALETSSGHITGGGPSDPDIRKQLLDTGWRPYAIKIGDTYHPYNRFEPLATWMGTVADAVEVMDVATDKEQKDLTSKISQAVAKNLVDKSYVQGMAEMSDALHDPGRYGEKFISGRLSAVVPAVVGQAAKSMDPEMREVRGLVDSIKARIPVVRETLHPKRNIYGESIEQEGGFWMRYLSPSVPSHESGTPGKLALVESGADVGKLDRHLVVGNQHLSLDDDQYDRLQVLSGGYVKDLVEATASNPSFDRLTNEQKIEQLRQMVREGRSIGRTRFIVESKLLTPRR